MKTINILGETQREQWHGVVNMIRQLGGDLTREGRSQLCDEIDRYIDNAENVFDGMREKSTKKKEVWVYALMYCDIFGGIFDVMGCILFPTLEKAQEAMKREVDKAVHDLGLDENNLGAFQSIEVRNMRAFVENNSDEFRWTIEKRCVEVEN